MPFTSDLTAYNTLTVGKTYRVAFTQIWVLSGTLDVKLGSTVIGTVSSSGPKSYSGVANGTDLVLTANDFEGEFSVGDCMVTEVGQYSDPVVITSNNFEEKTKDRIKNINYEITYQKAFDKTIQRF